MDKCVACQYYDRQLGKTTDGKGVMWGQCRRTAPMLHPIVAKSYMIEGVWPHVRDDDWCGEWKQAVRRAEARPVEMVAATMMPRGPVGGGVQSRPSGVASLQVAPGGPVHSLTTAAVIGVGTGAPAATLSTSISRD